MCSIELTLSPLLPPPLQGVLTITLIRCINLKGDDITSYVRFLVSDENQDLVQKSAPVFSQQSPRWGTKFDFVMITAGEPYFLGGRGQQVGRLLTSSLITAGEMFLCSGLGEGATRRGR